MMDTEREAVSLNENLQTVRDSTSAGSESREENLLLSQLPTNVNVPTTTETVHEIADGTASCQTAAMEVDCPLAGDTDASPPPVAASPTDSYQRVVMETDRQQAIAISTDNCQGVAMTQDNQQDNRLAIASPTGSSQGGTMEMDSQQATAVSASYQPVDSNVNFTSNLFESHTQSQELPPLSVVISGGNGNDRFSDERLRRLAFRCVGILHILAGLLLVLPDGILIYYNYIDWSKCVGLWMSAFYVVIGAVLLFFTKLIAHFDRAVIAANLSLAVITLIASVTLIIYGSISISRTTDNVEAWIYGMIILLAAAQVTIASIGAWILLKPHVCPERSQHDVRENFVADDRPPYTISRLQMDNGQTGVDNEDLRGYDSATRIRDDIAPVQPPPYMASPPPYETVINEHQ